MDAEQAANLATYFTENVLEKVSAALASGDGVPESLASDLEYLQADFADRLSALVGVDKSAPVDVSVLKVDEEQRMVWGWGSVTTMKGEPVTDRQGDVIDTADMQKAVHNYIRSSRVGKTMHKGAQTGDVVDSIFFTKAVQDALGIDLGVEGWFVGKYVADDITWNAYKSGKLKAFSFGGNGTRTPIDEVGKFNDNHGSDGKFSSGGGGGASGGGSGGEKFAHKGSLGTPVPGHTYPAGIASTHSEPSMLANAHKLAAHTKSGATVTAAHIAAARKKWGGAQPARLIINTAHHAAMSGE